MEVYCYSCFQSSRQGKNSHASRGYSRLFTANGNMLTLACSSLGVAKSDTQKLNLAFEKMYFRYSLKYNNISYQNSTFLINKYVLS